MASKLNPKQATKKFSQVAMELRKNSKHGPYSALEVAILGAIFGEAKMREFLKPNLIMTRTG